MDYTKGIILKLKAFEELLSNNSDLRGKVQLIQVAIPSRTNVLEYINLRHEVERLVGEINGKFSTINYVPIKYIFNSINKTQLTALYRSSDILFITSKRDGMNLVSLEYVACQDIKNPGVVVLSEFAGAASMLSEALLINPMDIRETVQTLLQALNMPFAQKVKRHKVMLDFLQGYTATDWANTFIKDLKKFSNQNGSTSLSLDQKNNRNKILRKIKNKKQFILIDYDGTLTPIRRKPEHALLDNETKKLIIELSNDKDSEVIVLSGRPMSFLQKQLKDMNIYIAAEHGGKFLDYKKNKWHTLVSSNRHLWYEQAFDVITNYTKRIPHSFLEEKDFAIAWHYRNSPSVFSELEAKKLVKDLEQSLVNLPINVIAGKKVIEVKSVEANKGNFATWFLNRYHCGEAVLAMGDDKTDEDMFRALQDNAITIKVGSPEKTYAKYFIKKQKTVKNLLKEILESRRPKRGPCTS